MNMHLTAWLIVACYLAVLTAMIVGSIMAVSNIGQAEKSIPFTEPAVDVKIK